MGYGLGTYGGGTYASAASPVAGKATVAATTSAALSGLIAQLAGKLNAASAGTSHLAAGVSLKSAVSVPGSSVGYGANLYGGGVYGTVDTTTRPALASGALRGSIGDSRLLVSGALVSSGSIGGHAKLIIGLSAVVPGLPVYGSGAYGAGIYGAAAAGFAGLLPVAAATASGRLGVLFAMSGVAPATVLAGGGLFVRVPVFFAARLGLGAYVRGNLGLVGTPVRLVLYVAASEASMAVIS